MGLNFKGRLQALDLFRGITIAGMILVNNPGTWSNVYSPLLHANWHGCTPTDLVFPFFLFIVGVSIHLAIGRLKLNGFNDQKVVLKIIKRAFVLFLIGLFLNAFPNFDLGSLRIPGVLQRIAVVYAVVSLLYLYCSVRTINAIGIAILAGYYFLLKFDPTVALGEALYGKGTNITNVLDYYLLEGHLWSLSKTWDPEGILSTLPSIVTTIIGVNAGVLIKDKSKQNQISGYFLSIGGILVVLGLFWGLDFPINKALWSSSYVLYTGGIAFLFLGTLHFIVDVLGKGSKMFFPFKVFGLNAIGIYVLSGIGATLLYTLSIGGVSLQGWIMQVITSLNVPLELASLIYALSFTLSMYGICWILYRRKIFIKV